MTTRDFFESTDGTRLYKQTWGTPEKGVIVLLPGFADHLGRHKHLVRALTERGYGVEGFDHRGNGQSGGVRGHVEHFDQYIEDLHAFLRPIWQYNKPTFLLGQSHGAHIALRYGLLHPKSELIGVIAAAPFLGMNEQLPMTKRWMASLASTFWPRFHESNKLQIEVLSHDPDIIEETKQDPLYGRVATARWYTETLKAMDETIKRAHEFTYPLLMQLAGEEKIVDPNAGRRFFEKVHLNSKSIIEYPGYFHEIYNETPDRRGPVFEDLGNWLDDNLP
ncbi:MAG: hypothetical protein CL920_07350 [Deltaproteobacteria bacterium]|nr:hypothetical protein [Deltaproteobacteria bacterium]MBU48493.1 hypothetical protein [Deltaproteobacteria bacterium]|tara:strand:+ start:1706 stop:2536 length:831 start_codon:yes stop_codon:yes gene_type:complete